MRAEIIPSDSPSLFDVLKVLTTLERGAIVRPDNPPPGIAGFLFGVTLDDGMELTSEITDHFVEDNTAIQDQIALKPEQVTVRGLVAELESVSPQNEILAASRDPLPENEAMVPELAPQAEQIQEGDVEAATSAAVAVASAGSLWKYFDQQSAQRPNQTKQAKALLYLYALWKARQLFTVETPWGFFTNVAILTVRARQPEDSRFASEFTVVFKKIRTAAELVVAPGQLAGRAALQEAPLTQNGNAGKKEQTAAEKSSLLYKMMNP